MPSGVHAFIEDIRYYALCMPAGTFDVSLLHLQDGGHNRVLAVGGDAQLGGEDIDVLLSVS